MDRALDLQPAVRHQAPHRLDAVELWAVGRHEFKLDALLLHEYEHWLDGNSIMYGDVVEHEHEILIDLAAHTLHRAQKGLGSAAPPGVGVHDSASAGQRGYGIGALAKWSIGKVLLDARRLGTAVGVNLSEIRLVEVGQFDLASQRLCPQLFKLLAGLGEGGGVSFFACCGGCACTTDRWPGGL